MIMKKKVMLYVLMGMMVISCSTDKMADATSGGIIGTWDLTALEINDGSASSEEAFAQDILDILSASDCHLLTLTFNEDLTLVTQDATNYLEIGVNGSGIGLEVPCPSQRDTFTTPYIYAEGTLTFTDENQQSVTVDVVISGNTMVISAQDLDVENFNAGGNLVFSRR